MAAGLGFKDFTTGEVLTAADVDGYLMQGIWVFADSAARDAAVTSPQEGNFAYLKDTNVTTYYTGSAWANLDTTGMTNPMTTTGDTIYSSSGSTPARLGIGSTGQVLTVAGGVPSWATPAGGGGMTLLSTTTLSGSSVTISTIDQTYTNLKIIITGGYNSTNADLLMRLNGNSTASNYDWFYFRVDGGGTVIGSATIASSLLIGLIGTSSTWSDVAMANIDIYRYAATENKAIFWSEKSKYSANDYFIVGTGQFLETTAISSITLLPDTGTFSGGTAYLYGVK